MQKLTDPERRLAAASGRLYRGHTRIAYRGGKFLGHVYGHLHGAPKAEYDRAKAEQDALFGHAAERLAEFERSA